MIRIASEGVSSRFVPAICEAIHNHPSGIPKPTAIAATSPFPSASEPVPLSVGVGAVGVVVAAFSHFRYSTVSQYGNVSVD